jgi:hypothetical protein
MLWQIFRILRHSCVVSLVLAAGLVAVPCISVSSAATIPIGTAIPLSDLIGDQAPPITVGDKVFSDFWYAATGDMPSAGDINVIPIVDGGNYGLRFQGGFLDAPGGGASDAMLGFHVEVDPRFPQFLISDVHLSGNPNVLGENNGTISVCETFMPLTDPMLDIYDDFGTRKVTDQALLVRPVRELDVQKDILALSVGSTATLSFIDQTFSQIIVPEPPGAMMLLVGFTVIAVVTWKGRTRLLVKTD